MSRMFGEQSTCEKENEPYSDLAVGHLRMQKLQPSQKQMFMSRPAKLLVHAMPTLEYERHFFGPSGC